MYEENRISYLELNRCTSKEQEVLNTSVKDDKHVSIDSAGTVKVRDKESKLEAYFNRLDGQDVSYATWSGPRPVQYP